jgi:glutathione synthase/RimK-type ligase-like ATP-grasp enzyme
MLKNNTPQDQRWRRHDDNSVWILETNEKFDKPVNWDDIVNESVKALNSVGLDIGAIDLKVQSRLDKFGNVRKNPKFIILETNSAPSFGEITSQKYLIEINKLLLNKKQNG